MKLLAITLLACPVLFMLNSCNPNYACGRICLAYRGGAVTVCQTNGNNQAFNNSVDSLNALYGQGTVSYTDTLHVTGTSDNAVNAIINQLEQQGYTCNSD